MPQLPHGLSQRSIAAGIQDRYRPATGERTFALEATVHERQNAMVLGAAYQRGGKMVVIKIRPLRAFASEQFAQQGFNRGH